MLRAILRPLSALLLVPMTAHLLACSIHTPPKPVAPAEVEDLRKVTVVGVTTVAGDSVMFDLSQTLPSRRDYDPTAKPRIVGDTLHARVDGQAWRLPVDQVQRYWIRQVSVGKTIGLVAAVVGGALAALALVIAATKESCPFVYSWDGSKWVFDGEPYGGATTRGLERDDWSELEHLVEVDGEYRIRVTNEVPETQYNDLLELIVVDHEPGTRVVADGRGGFLAVRSSVAPVEAVDETGRDLAAWLVAEDRRVWEPAPDPVGVDDRSEITLAFPKPAGATRATLLHRVGTGIWGSYMIKAMLQLHGNELDAWYASLDSDPAARRALHDWNLREELYELKVEVERSGRWETAGTLSGGGPFVLESRGVPIDLAGVEGDRLRLRLRPPRGFWALDAFAIEYGTPAAPTAVRRVTAVRAEDQLGRDVLSTVTAGDGEYWAMPTNDDRAEIAFPAPPATPGTERTVFLHARGWYRIHLDESAPRDREALLRIATVPGAAARYAAEAFARWHLALR